MQLHTDVIGDTKMIIDGLYTEGNYNHVGEIDVLKKTPIIQK